MPRSDPVSGHYPDLSDPSTAVFDLDGTLADTSADLLAAANRATGTRLLKVETDAAVAVRGGRAMLRLIHERRGRALDAGALEEEYRRFLDIYADALHVKTVLYDGVEAALDTLTGRGWLLAVCTNKPVGLADALVRSLGIRDRFDAFLGADNLPVRKPDPERYVRTVLDAGGKVEKSVMIGDTVTDIETAANARVPCIVVRFSPGGVPAGFAGPVLDRFADLPDMAAAAIGAAP